MMSDRENGVRDPGPFHTPGRAKPRANPTPRQRLFGFIIGCAFALAGLACVANAVANVEDMKKPPEIVYSPGDTGDDGGYSLLGGFGVGLQAFFGMLFVGVGVGVAATSAATSPVIRRGIAAILALAWHGVGIGACWCYCSLAPALDVYPFLIVMAYEWLGLIRLSEHLRCNFREFLPGPVGLTRGGRQLERGPVRRWLPPVCSYSSRAATCGNVHLSKSGRCMRYLRTRALT